MSESASQQGEILWDAVGKEFRISGDLTLATVTNVMAQATPLFSNAADITVDLGDVNHSDSAGLALLIEWMRVAAAANKPIVFQHIPRQMLAIAETTGLDAILPLKKKK